MAETCGLQLVLIFTLFHSNVDYLFMYILLFICWRTCILFK